MGIDIPRRCTPSQPSTPFRKPHSCCHPSSCRRSPLRSSSDCSCRVDRHHRSNRRQYRSLLLYIDCRRRHSSSCLTSCRRIRSHNRYPRQPPRTEVRSHSGTDRTHITQHLRRKAESRRRNAPPRRAGRRTLDRNRSLLRCKLARTGARRTSPRSRPGQDHRVHRRSRSSPRRSGGRCIDFLDSSSPRPRKSGHSPRRGSSPSRRTVSAHKEHHRSRNG